MTAADKKRRGNFGEQYVCERLEKSGYKIVQKNYRKKCGEIDIIAEKDDWLAFVEVKTRTENPLATGVSAVNKNKQKKLVQTAQLFLTENNYEEKQIRFDVAEVVIARNEPLRVVKINYYKSAFDPSGCDMFLFV